MNRGLALALALLCSVAACSSVRPRTEVVVRVIAEPMVAAETASLHLVVRAGPNRSQDSLATRTERDVPDMGALSFPYEIGLVPADGDAARVFEVTVTASRADGSYVGTARVVSGYVDGQTLTVSLRLEDSCLGRPACDPGNTCHLAMCVDAYVDPATLATYAPSDAAVGPTIDGGVDASADTGTSPPSDGGTDAAMDAAFDAGATATDAGIDAFTSVDATIDTTADGGGFAPPRLLSPLSTSSVRSRRPTFRWIGGGPGAMLVLCPDRACATPIETVPVSGTSAQPTSDLPPGPVFWRVTSGAVSSYTWEVFVPAVTTGDTSFGTTLDVDGDGFGDVAVGADGAGRVRIYRGSASGIVTPAAWTINGPAGQFGTVVASAGDRNGDGYGDLAIASLTGSPFGGASVKIYLGGPTGLDTTTHEVLTGGDMTAHYGAAVACVGDWNEDGFADLAVGAPDHSASTGFVSIDFGWFDAGTSPTSQRLDPAATLGAAPRFGASIAAGDLDQDGFVDIIVGAPAAASGAGALILHGGGPAAAGTAVVIATGPAGTGLGHSLATGDLDGDGFDDCVGGAPADASHSGQFLAVYGRSSGAVAGPTGVGPAGVAYGVSVALADTNGDGASDLFVGADLAASGGYVYEYDGVLGGDPSTTATLVVMGPGAGAHFGASVANVGDLDADGYCDLAVGAYGALSGAGRLYPYSGGASGITPRTPIDGPDASGSFGHTLASAAPLVCEPAG